MSKTAGGAEPKLSALSPAAQEAVRSNAISGQYNVNTLTELLAELEKWDLQLEANRARMKRLFMGSCIGAFFGFAAFIVVSATVGAVALGLVLFVVPVVCIFVFKRALNDVKRKDLPNELRDTLRPMFTLLRHDLHPQAKIRTTINLAVMDETRGEKSTLPPQGSDKSRELTVFQQELCDIRMPLADGSTAVLRLSNVFHKLKRTYRASSGKTKFKTKWKKLSTVTAMLVPAQPIVWAPEQVQQFMDETCEKLSFSDANGVSAARIDRHYKFKKEQDPPEDSSPVQDVVALFVRLTAMRPLAQRGAQ